MTEPFDQLSDRDWSSEEAEPRAEFVRDLKAQVRQLLDVADLSLGEDRHDSAASPTSTTTTAVVTTATQRGTEVSETESATTSTAIVTPYLTVGDGAAALDFYARAFGAVEVMRMAMGPDGPMGHAEFHIGGAPFYLSEEFPDMSIAGPVSLGGTTVAIHLTVDDVDATYANAIANGATELAAVADQPHGHRQGTLSDPFGHRWMLSQEIEAMTYSEIAERLSGGGEVTLGPGADNPPAPSASGGGIWAALNYADAEAGIKFCVDVLGFETQIVVPGESPGEVVHSQLQWPEGGIVQAASANREGNEFSARPIGTESLYVITADPMAVHARCVAAGVDIVLEPSSPDYDAPGGINFTIRDPEGNLWSFGTYAGEN